MIKAIFYSPKVIHQVPNNSVTASPNSAATPLIHFPSVSPTIIPRQTFCSLPLTLLSYPYRVLSHPICLTSASYPRNEFIFSFSLLLHHRTSTTAFVSVVSKLAALFKNLEETTRFLSKDSSPPNAGKIYGLCEILLEDLNNYSEAMIPIDDCNTINIKLFPAYPPPPSLAPHNVPLATVRLASLKDDNWDITMLRVIPFIDGINSIRAIALLADADYRLVRKAIAHLIYYGCVMLLDVFSFGACYAPTAEMGAFVADAEMQNEGRRYVLSPESSSGMEYPGNSDRAELIRRHVDGSGLVELYFSLRQGHSLRNWCMEHAEVVGIVDIRRFITFGVIKGFLYRVHKYATITGATVTADKHLDRSGGSEGELNKIVLGGGDAELSKYLDGMHCFDEICTELMISEKELLARLKTWGDVQIIHR